MNAEFPKVRLRRLRVNEKVRELVAETRLSVNNLIYPLFVKEGIQKPEPISSMPGVSRHTIDSILEECRDVVDLGIPAILLFPAGITGSLKDEIGSYAYSDNGIVQQTVEAIKREFSNELIVITDVCMCEYTDHGHCGVIDAQQIKNDPTLELLARQAVSHAAAGADIVAPSDMMDGRINTIRENLDNAGFQNTAIMSYAAKYASSFYGPFRDAVDSAPKAREGIPSDRKTYQMDYRNASQAIREIELDIAEGADIIMVKPALIYLDIIRRAKERFNLPLAAYNISGEYSMVAAAAERGWLDWREAILEITTSIKRAGADLIMTYAAKDLARWI